MTENEDLSKLTFEQMLSRLEQLTEKLASGDIGIETAADLYEQAQRLHAAASERLATVQQRIEGLSEAPG